MRSSFSRTSRRGLSCVVAAVLLVAGPAPLSLGAAPTGNVVLFGQVFDESNGAPLPGATVHAVHLDTKEVYSSAPTDSGGRYIIERVPYGYYDLAVESGGSLYLSNRVISAPAGERVEASMALGQPQIADSGWWSADPNRRVPGLNRVPDGVGRIVEGAPRRARAPKRVKEPRPARATGGSEWLLPALAAGGLAALAILADDDEDNAEDEGLSPF